jgi:hypothetical protein
MNKNEKVVIKIKEKNLNPPVKCDMLKNPRPSENFFKVKPRAFPQLSNFIKSVRWKAVEKRIYIKVSETAFFECYKWINYIKEKNQELEKIPFNDLDANCLDLVFQDNGENDVATLRLKNLSLVDHDCVLNSRKNSQVFENSLKYKIVLSYQYEEFFSNKPKNDSGKIQENESDEEWQTIESP